MIEILFQLRVFTDSGKLAQGLSGKVNDKRYIFYSPPPSSVIFTYCNVQVYGAMA